MNVKRKSLLMVAFILGFCQLFVGYAQQPAEPDINFSTLPTSWDEGLPLGNGQLGALIWQKGQAVRFSLDRADLWDDRPVKAFNRAEFKFDWVQRQYLASNYKKVQELFDDPYNKEPAPTKIPGAALEIYPEGWGEVTNASVDVSKALAAVTWSSGVRLQSFVAANQQYGFFRIQNTKQVPFFKLIPPSYEGSGQAANDLARLGYKQGKVDSFPNGYTYLQEGWDGFKYRVTVYITKMKKGDVEGIWQITSGKQEKGLAEPDLITLKSVYGYGFDYQLTQHVGWWKKFWDQSDIQVPDPAIQRDWKLAMYFLGSTSRPGGPPISLQAVWTADNGKLPPWKGDFHHDLNTQMSYWPAYTANHLDEAMLLPEYLDSRKDEFKSYTSRYFGKEGINVPGVTSFNGQALGGWIQYAFSPTVSAWLAHHFFMQWRFSMDQAFLRDKAYPWVRQAAVFMEQFSEKDANGRRKLPLSSSPEIHNNDASAWFTETTNYDLALMKSLWRDAAVMARALGNESDAAHWDELAAELRPLAISNEGALKIAPTLVYENSHRHFSHLMSIYPLGVLNWNEGDSSRQIINQSLHLLDSLGSSQWTGYSFAWLANLKARAMDADGALKALQIFSEAFTSKNGFHVNGDQSGKGYSSMKYRPFTLEGNFAFASGLQEMLLQSFNDTVQVMPAVPDAWQDVSFNNLRAEGGFLISARKEAGKVKQVLVLAEQDGYLNIRLPVKSYRLVFAAGKGSRRSVTNGTLRIYLLKGTVMEINPTR